MPHPLPSQYRIYLMRKALSRPFYTLPAAAATAGSVLSSLIEPHLPLFGLLMTATGMYIGLESVVLRFPPAMRPQFRAWFRQYHRLCALTPVDSGIQLRGTSVDPDVILRHLEHLTAKQLGPAHFAQFEQTINAAFQSLEAQLLRARETHEQLKFDQIARSIREETQQVAASVENYRTAVTSIYADSDDARLAAQHELDRTLAPPPNTINQPISPDADGFSFHNLPSRLQSPPPAEHEQQQSLQDGDR